MGLATRHHIASLLFIFLYPEDLRRGFVAVAGSIGISHPDIKDCLLAASPKSFHAYITAKDLGSSVPGAFSSGCWLIVGDCRFISNSCGRFGFSTELVPFSSEFIMALED